MTGEWFTYRQAAELLSLSTEAVRARAKRGRWQKTLGNDKRTRIRPPDGWNDIVRVKDDRALRARVLDERALANQVIRALEALEMCGSGEARDVLAALAKGAPGAYITEQAKAALKRVPQGP